jgi:hypothetical protein
VHYAGRVNGRPGIRVIMSVRRTAPKWPVRTVADSGRIRRGILG